MTVDPINPAALHEGMEVVGSDGKRVGRVKKVRETDMFVDRPMRPDISISFGFIRFIQGDRIVLTIPSDEAAGKDWQRTL